MRSSSLLPSLIAVSILAGCNAILGLDKLSLGSEASDGGSDAPPTGPIVDATPDGYVGECTTNAECTERATAAALDAGTLPDAADGGQRVMPAICQKPEGRCVELLSPDCEGVEGDFTDDDAIVIATLFTTVGAQRDMNLQRQRGAQLAAKHIAKAGGIPPATTPGSSNRRRPLVMVSCNEANHAGAPGVTVLNRVGAHLITNLRVPAIVGPNTSQDTLDLAKNISVESGTLVLTPTAVASSVAELMDSDLTWLMVPSDVQRGPLMINQINQIEEELRIARNKQLIRLGIIYRDDAVGAGTYGALRNMTLNGKPLSDNINVGVGGNVAIDVYNFTAPIPTALVNRYADEFKPDILVLAGLAEVITGFMNPFEERLPDGGADRPYYVFTDQLKGPDLINSATRIPGLRSRVRGTGITPGMRSEAVHSAFLVDYRVTFGQTPSASGAGPSYDAASAIAYALAATRDMPVTGANIAKGLRKLAGGAVDIEVNQTNVPLAFNRLGAGENINAIGTFLPYEWDDRGAVVNGTIEIWCITQVGMGLAYQSAGLYLDIKTGGVTGMYTPCP
jgi:ABC-type branched-subunit amino acid transport system substrate-binding protein